MGENENDNLKHYRLHDVIEIDSKALIQKSKTNEFIIVDFFWRVRVCLFFVIFDNGTLKPLHALWHSHGHIFLITGIITKRFTIE